MSQGPGGGNVTKEVPLPHMSIKVLLRHPKEAGRSSRAAAADLLTQRMYRVPLPTGFKPAILCMGTPGDCLWHIYTGRQGRERLELLHYQLLDSLQLATGS